MSSYDLASGIGYLTKPEVDAIKEIAALLPTDPITSPATPAAAEWNGWGTALKPAWEPIIVARKPLQGTVAENVQRYGTGAMNVDACRIDVGEDTTTRHNSSSSYMTGLIGSTQPLQDKYITGSVQGRWPANLIHDGSAEVLAGFPNGSAARFFYCAKASKADRDEGCEELDEVEAKRTQDGGDDTRGRPIPLNRNHHPTVKPTALMRYLCRLVTPPQGVILDPFMGSGSTGKAAILEGFNFIGIDTEIEYVEIAARRIERACEKVGIVVEQPMLFETKRETIDKPKQLILL